MTGLVGGKSGQTMHAVLTARLHAYFLFECFLPFYLHLRALLLLLSCDADFGPFEVVTVYDFKMGLA